MGNCCCKKESVKPSLPPVGPVLGDAVGKEGSRYTDVKGNLQSFDLLLFRGGDFISDFIRFIERRVIRDMDPKLIKRIPIKHSNYSHVGMVVKSDILNHPTIKEGEVYIWESTMSGDYADGVPNIDGVPYFGVQLRKFDEVMDAYDRPLDTAVAVAPLNGATRTRVWKEGESVIQERFTSLFNRLNGITYDANLYSLFSAAYPCLRGRRQRIEEAMETEEWLFCSELVATVYVTMGIYPVTVNPKNVIPIDFIGFDRDSVADGGVPIVVEEPQLMVSDFHYRGEDDDDDDSTSSEED